MSEPRLNVVSSDKYKWGHCDPHLKEELVDKDFEQENHNSTVEKIVTWNAENLFNLVLSVQYL